MTSGSAMRSPTTSSCSSISLARARVRSTAWPDVEPHIVGLWYPSNVMAGGRIRKTQIRRRRAAPPRERGRSISKTSSLTPRASRIMSTLSEIGAGAFAPIPRHDKYTCLAAWGKGCDYAWVCPGRIEEPEDYEAE